MAQVCQGNNSKMSPYIMLTTKMNGTILVLQMSFHTKKTFDVPYKKRKPLNHYQTLMGSTWFTTTKLWGIQNHHSINKDSATTVLDYTFSVQSIMFNPIKSSLSSKYLIKCTHHHHLTRYTSMLLHLNYYQWYHNFVNVTS